MSKRFYNYLSKKLIEYLSNSSINPGERFYVQFDNQEQVEDFYAVLRECKNVESFSYKHERGGSYETFSIKLDELKLVVAATIGVTSGYMVTIRNASQEQREEWENTALLILCSEPLDSIKGGCRDLTKEGMPFNVKVISDSLGEEIEKSSLTKVDKEILNFHIGNKLSDSYNNSLWDYEEILGIIDRQTIENDDYRKIGLFKDKALEGMSVSSMRKRLKENNTLYAKVEAYEEYENKRNELEKIFDDRGVNLLDNKNWRDANFINVKQSYENNKKDKALGYIEDTKRKLPEGVVYWERAKTDTASGRRKRHIIIFNPLGHETIELRFTFDDRVEREFINTNSKKYMSPSGKALNVKLPAKSEDSLFFRLVYNHKNQAKSKYEFNIAIVNIHPSYLDNIKTIYEVKTGAGDKNRIFINNDGSDLIFGMGSSETEIVLEEENQLLELKEEDRIKVTSFSSEFDEEAIRFRLRIEGNTIPIEIKDQYKKGTPINSIRLAKLKRERQESFVWVDNKVKQGNDEYFIEDKLKKTLLIEQEIINKGIAYGSLIVNNEVEPLEAHYSQELLEAYNSIVNYYRERAALPTLTAMDDELFELYDYYLGVFNKEIEDIEENTKLSNINNKKWLLKLGTIISHGRIMFSPLAPLNVAYRLELWKQLQEEQVESHILERIIPNNLLPYIYNDDNELYRPIYQRDSVEWIIYESTKYVSVGETNAFVARVINEKLEQFITHFTYLFSKKSNAPIKINVINIINDKEVVKGVFEYIKSRVSNNSGVIPIELKIYNKGQSSDFDTFFSMTDIDKLEEYYDISFKTKNNDIDPVDLLRIVLSNVKYYKCNDDEYDYAHISFYKSGQEQKPAQDNTNELMSGLSLGGLLASVTSNNNGDDYRIGFGTKNSIEADNKLLRTAINLNEYAVNLENQGVNPYKRNISIVTRPLTIEKAAKERLYEKSHWITFIEPSFGLEYFTEDNKDGLIVIHYSDQYSATEQYDTITVTNKSEQYKYIIQEFLSKKNITINDDRMNEVIKSFNSINGEWLLNLIKNKSEYDREKLSIISALKYGLALLDHEDIIWVPVSLEEILRISSAVKLNKSEGIFSVKNLKEKGVHSDDLIFIGVNTEDPDCLKLYYYPVEVKIGYNFSSVITKGSEQIRKTYKLLKDQLGTYEVDGHKLFKNKFFRNFFIRLLLANGQKLVANNIWPEKHMERLNDLKKYLLNDDYTVSFDLEEIIGKGALISFKKENHWRSLDKENGILYIGLMEEDAYRGIGEEVESLKEKILSGKQDIPQDKLLANVDIKTLPTIEIKGIDEEEDDTDAVAVGIEDHNSGEGSVSGGAQVIDSNGNSSIGDGSSEDDIDEGKSPIDNSEVDGENSKLLLDKVRILLGEAEGSTKKIYWEYGSKELANRHLLITGKSGNGKTYFIQCAIKELVNQGVPVLIIDYTDGFKASQLEPEFKEALQDRIKRFIVAKDKFPLNPFKKGQKELDEDVFIDEDAVDVAERFKGVVGAVYKDLGIQQLNAIYQAVIRGLGRYDGRLNLSAFRSELEEDGSSYSQTALSQLSVLLDKNPFEENKDFQWDEMDNSGGKLFIIQLTGFTKDVQRIITEMILWDLWNYKSKYGNKNKPFAVVLDEAQNLNFSDNAPSTKILTEGRKFGWSAWFATQFLKGQMDKATISRLQNAAEKIYFAQTEEEASTVATNFADNAEDRKNWTKKLINLNKGSCIVYGPIKSPEGKLLAAQPVKINITALDDRK